MDISRFELIEELGNTPYESELTKGSKIKCVSVSEHQSNWGGNDSAKDYLIIGSVYTLSRDPEVHSWYTKYYLENEITDAQWYAIDLLNEYYNIKFNGKTKQDAVRFIRDHKDTYEQAKLDRQRDSYEKNSFYRDGYERNGWW